MVNSKSRGNLFKVAATIALTATFFYATPSSSLAAEGGWAEGEGYWSNIESSKTNFDVISPMAVEDPGTGGGGVKHWANFEQKFHSGTMWERVVGNTVWNGKYHYSRARYETSSNVYADSGRRWKWDASTAYSGYVGTPNIYVAHTYYGY